MEIAKSDLVLATAGREKGRLFFVVDVQNEYLLLADGKSRRLEALAACTGSGNQDQEGSTLWQNPT